MFQCCHSDPQQQCLHQDTNLSLASSTSGQAALVASPISSACQSRAKEPALPLHACTPGATHLTSALFALPEFNGHCSGCCSKTQSFHQSRGVGELILQGELAASATPANSSPSFVTSFKGSSRVRPPPQPLCAQTGFMLPVSCSHVPLCAHLCRSARYSRAGHAYMHRHPEQGDSRSHLLNQLSEMISSGNLDNCIEMDSEAEWAQWEKELRSTKNVSGGPRREEEQYLQYAFSFCL